MIKKLCMSLDSLAEAINRRTIEMKKQTIIMQESLELQHKANDLAERTVSATENAFDLAGQIMDGSWSFGEEDE